MGAYWEATYETLQWISVCGECPVHRYVAQDLQGRCQTRDNASKECIGAYWMKGELEGATVVWPAGPGLETVVCSCLLQNAL